MDFIDLYGFFCFAGLLGIITIWILVTSLKNGIGPVPTSAKVRRKALTLMPEQIEGNIVELGAGWGGMTLALAKKYPHHQIIAMENCVPAWCICRLRIKLFGNQNIEVRLADIYQTNFDSVGLIYCYLCQNAMRQLEKQLTTAPLRPNNSNIILISNTFSLPSHKAEQAVRADDLWQSTIYRYRLPSPASLN